MRGERSEGAHRRSEGIVIQTRAKYPTYLIIHTRLGHLAAARAHLLPRASTLIDAIGDPMCVLSAWRIARRDKKPHGWCLVATLSASFTTTHPPRARHCSSPFSCGQGALAPLRPHHQHNYYRQSHNHHRQGRQRHHRHHHDHRTQRCQHR